MKVDCSRKGREDGPVALDGGRFEPFQGPARPLSGTTSQSCGAGEPFRHTRGPWWRFPGSQDKLDWRPQLKRRLSDSATTVFSNRMLGWSELPVGGTSGVQLLGTKGYNCE